MGIHLQYDERLWILRTGDHFRSWESLDDQRFCILCEKTFTGRRIEITRQQEPVSIKTARLVERRDL